MDSARARRFGVDKFAMQCYSKTMFGIISSLVRYVFITTIYVFVFAIIRMIYKDIRHMMGQEEFVATQSNPILRVIGYRDKTYHGARNDYPLDKSKVIIGRSKSADIMIEDMLVSTKHVCLWFDEGEWHIKDLNSKNGTYLNEQHISEPYLLDDGDIIRVGEMQLEFKL